ncbi:bifunctional diaminohydroxyphosphoribosylaminopyrimidine deaminase/5-amino-6-(5-phosphoribosylamino)uracil reductase RibD [Sediminitomix flava]|uniref:Riboflavin biosynthesis protein RibD n=1 Tax=Sediminitomix flava TaxID=379075 RepID=A0A315ZAF8_SEDFL|nr:bifunctional diaminohydroxyphosphoribosylaminopyrimidine deaminase/5-amino-6-(5-phosphoribosylamino)uracil reductase RibD [Sediminitomix flava]PWJ42576.1 diaminohydroxyphosphoribosylaminopyrimidine deaminase [Sediminitomix flava]
MQTKESFMNRALELALLGFGKVSPNPIVGCVIVKDGKIIGEGYHKVYGGPHAEVNAVNSVINKEDIKGSDVYVTLEPCSHYGKTPPCADLLVKHLPKKVIVCNLDPNPLVAGRGMKKLEDAGIETEVGVLEDKGLEINRRFFTFMQEKRPYIILKWAQTADGYVARKNFDSKWISNSFSRKMVHKWRAEEDSIMVGRNTAQYDNPSLNVRDWQGKDPVRVVIDSELKLSKDLNLFDQTIPTLCYNLKQDLEDGLVTYIKVEKENYLSAIFTDLFERKLQSIIIEGGSYLLQKCIDENFWDEARVFMAKTTFGDGIKAPSLKNAKFISENELQGDKLQVLRNI